MSYIVLNRLPMSEFHRCSGGGLCSRSQIVVRMLRIKIDLTKLQPVNEFCVPGLTAPVQESVLFKSFSFGFVFGLIAAAGLLYVIPVVDQVRERSIISVRANGGNSESLHVNLPIDRVFAGRADLEHPVPPGLDWPDNEFLSGTQTELFKVRNAEEKVVGVASRIVGGVDQPFVEWVVHMPARGSMYLVLADAANESGVRVGSLRSGTREFALMSGVVTERYIAADETTNDGISGRLELMTFLVGQPDKVEPAEGDEL